MIEGTILQQSRTAVQIRTPDGKVLTVDKTDIRMIHYGTDKSPEEKRRIEAERLKELQKKEQLKREAEKKAAEERREKELADERLKKEAAEKSRKEKEEKERVEREKQKNNQERRTVQKTWWIEPFLSTGSGKYRSNLEAVFKRHVIGYQIYSRDSTYGLYSLEPAWSYGDHSQANYGIRAGKDRWVIEADIYRLKAQGTLFQHDTALPHVDGGDTVFQYLLFHPLDGISESDSIVRAGYRFLDRGDWSFTVLVGHRTTSASTNYYTIGEFVSLFGDGTSKTTPINPAQSSMELYGSGPELMIESSWKSKTLPFSFSARLGTSELNVRSDLFEMYVFSNTFSDNISMSLEKDRYQFRSYSYLLKGSYRTFYDIELYIALQITTTRARIRKVRDVLSISYDREFDEFYNLPSEQFALAKIYSPQFEKNKNAGVTRILQFGISRRFSF